MNVTNINQTPPGGITPKQQRSQFNNDYAMALAAGDPRYQAKELDRAGMSRGAGTMNQAGIRASKAFADGVANAYGSQLGTQQYNANLAQSNQAGMEQFGQALTGLQQQSAYANQMAGLQRQNALYGLIGNLLR